MRRSLPVYLINRHPSRFRRRLGPLARFALGWRRHLGNDIKNRQSWCGSFRIYTDGLWPSGMAQSPQPYDLAARHLVRAPLDAVCSSAKVRDWATIKRRPVEQSSSRLRSGHGSSLKPKLQPSRQRLSRYLLLSRLRARPPLATLTARALGDQAAGAVNLPVGWNWVNSTSSSGSRPRNTRHRRHCRRSRRGRGRRLPTPYDGTEAVQAAEVSGMAQAAFRLIACFASWLSRSSVFFSSCSVLSSSSATSRSPSCEAQVFSVP